MPPLYFYQSGILSIKTNNRTENFSIFVFNDHESMSSEVADYFVNLHNEKKERCYIIPGGTTPECFYSRLAEEQLDWSKTTLILSDERLVEVRNPLSNAGLIQKKFIGLIKSKVKPYLTAIYHEGMTPEQMCITFSKILNDDLFDKRPDLAILGLGDDGHTASLFPGDYRIVEKNFDDYCVMIKNDRENFFRLSLTFNCLFLAKEILFIISGIEKAEALSNCLNGEYNPIKWPAQYVLRNYEQQVNIFCDKSAADSIINNHKIIKA